MSIDFSIIIPIEDKFKVEETLSVISEDRRRYKHGKTEIIVICNQDENDQKSIDDMQICCQKFGAEYIACNDSISQKRQKGIVAAKYDYVLFFDAKAETQLGVLDSHAKIYQENQDESLGGVGGITTLIDGISTKPKQFYLRALEYCACTKALRQAQYKSEVDYLIWNNSSFTKRVLTEIRLANQIDNNKICDDMEFCLRASKSGYKFKTTPQAVSTLKCGRVDNKAVKRLINKTAVSDYYISRLHPELLFKPLPSVFFVSLLVLFISLLASGITMLFDIRISWLPFSIGVLYCIIMLVVSFFLDTAHMSKCKKTKRNIFYYIMGKLMDLKYGFDFNKERKRNKDRIKTSFMLFGINHAKSEYSNQVRKIKASIIILAEIIFFALIAIRILRGA